MQQKVVTNQEHIQPQIQHLPQIQPHAAAQDEPDVTSKRTNSVPSTQHMTLFAGLNSSKIQSLSTCYSFLNLLGKMTYPLLLSHN